MADTERPKRLRGAKLLEEGYRAGYADGRCAGLAEARAEKDIEGMREAAMQLTLDKLRTRLASKPKRARRMKTEPAAAQGGRESNGL